MQRLASRLASLSPFSRKSIAWARLVVVSMALLAGFLLLALDSSTPQPVLAAPPPPTNVTALFVVGSTTLTAGDTAIKSRLEGLGLSVSVKAAASAVSADATGKGVVVISESVGSTDVNTKFRDVAVPVVVMEPNIYDDMMMTGPTLTVDYAWEGSQSQIRIDDPTHQMAANLAGTIAFTTAPTGFVWGAPGSSAIKVASLAGYPGKSAVFGYETGTGMVGMNAPARRTGLFLVHDSAAVINTNGWALFDAAIRWSANLSSFSLNSSALFVVASTTLSAGDTAIKNRLEGLGFTLTLKEAVSAVAGDATGKGLVVISESVASGDANSKFRDVAVPVVVMEQNIYDDMMLTGPTLNTDYGYLGGQAQVNIDNPTHQMAANLSGTVSVTSSSMDFAWAVPGSNAIKIASLVNQPTRYAVFGYEAGTAMVGMNAPARRAGVFLVHLTATNANSNAWALFDAAVMWTANRGINVAQSVNGGVATASSSFSLGYLPSGAINGDPNGINFGSGGGWMDGSAATFSDWLQVDFQGTKTIGEIDVFTVQDNQSSPSQPTEEMTFNNYGATNYAVQYWKDNSWVVVPYASVSTNSKVWRRFVFSNIRTSKIRVSVNDSADNTYSRIVEVEAWQSQSNRTPTANAGGPYWGVTGAGVSFNGNASVDHDGAIASYQWNFGDGATGTGATPSHTYSSTGTFNVTLTVTDNAGATASIATTATIAAGNQAPVANAGGPYLAPKNTVVQFNGTASVDYDGSISSYQWNFGDGATATGATPTHTYTTANTFTASLTVTDNSGAQNTAMVDVVVAQPDANISALKIFPGNVNLYTGASYIFAAVAYDQNNASVPGISYVWQTSYLGNDGLVSISQTGEFVAQTAGVYYVSAQAKGHKTQVTVTVTERPVACTENCGDNLQLEGDPVGWRPGDYPTGFDPDNTRGRPMAQSPDGNGNFQISLPIVALGGRGSDLDLTLRYNSRLWNKSGNNISYAIDKDWPAPGWSLGYGKMINMPEAGAFIIEPDGTRHSFKGTLTRTFTKYTYIAETTDGSFIKYRVDTSRNASTGVFDSPWATVKYPNGITVIYGSATAVYADGTFDMYPREIIDQNGNKISISYKWGNQDVSRRIETIKDSVGRVIQFHYDNSINGGLLTAITAAGLKDANGQTTVRTLARFHYKSHTFGTNLFSGLNMQLPSNPVQLIDAVYFPANGRGLWFGDSDSYSPYGMIRKVVEQRGMGFSTVSSDPVQLLKEQGTVTAGTMTAQQVYSYPETAQSLTAGPTFSTKTETWSGMTTAPAVTTYSATNASPRVITVIRPDNSQIIRYAHNYSSLSELNPLKLMNGRVFKEEFKDAGGTLLRRRTMDWENGYHDAPRVTRTESSEFANGQTLTTATEYGYLNGTYNQITQVRNYGFGNVLLSTTNATYIVKDRNVNQFDFYYEYAPMQLYLPASVEVRTAANARVSLVEFGYDQYDLENVYGRSKVPSPVHGVVQQAEQFNVYYGNGFNTPGPVPNKIMERGNLTSITRYKNAAAATGAIVDQLYYDITGNVVLKTSAGMSQKFQFIEGTHNAYPDTITVGSTTDPTLQVITSSTYDLNTGFALRSKDANGREIVRNYYPSSWRAKETISATGVQATFEYNDTAMTTTETFRGSVNGPIVDKTVQYYNGINKVYKREQLHAAASGGAPEVWSRTDIEYDESGRMKRETRPYGLGQTAQFTERTYDAVGRIIATADPRGSGSTFTYNAATRPAGASTVPGETVMSYDAWGRWRWARFDSTGSLAEVVEPNPAGGNGFQTLYTYDTVGNLTRIEQGSQVRRFAYDSLGRVTHQKLAETIATLNSAGAKATSEPEDQRWSTVFTYDDRSNLISHTDARGVKTNFSYSIGGNPDPLNRLQSVSYDTSMVDAGLTVLAAPTVTYQYRTKTAGQLIDLTQVAQVQVAGVSTEVFDYDTEGRPHEKRLTLAGLASPMTLTYDFDALNRLNQVTYPQQYQNNSPNPVRKVITPSYDIAGRVNNLRVNNVDYASQIIYNGESQVTSLKVGTGANQLTEQYSYDIVSGLLKVQTVTRGTTTLQNLSYDYHRGFCEDPNAPCDPTEADYWTTGQITRVVNGITNRLQHFNYDSLGRLIDVDQGRWTQPMPEFEFMWVYVNDWKQWYTYDRYGNRTGVANTDGILPATAVPTDGIASVSYDQSSNRITSSGFTYDAAGNQLTDGTGRSFVYDAAGRLAKIKNSSGNTIETYTYDGSRRRLITQNGNESSTSKTFYVWSGNKVVTEYVEPSGATMPKWSKNFIYFGEDLLATEEPNGSGGELVRYYHPDRLGNRLVTNNADTTSFSLTNLPFGTEINASPTGVTRRFTSYDRSATTLLDYAVNRYYDSRQGRFTQVDPIGMQAVDLLHPQTLNLYAYCGNDPVNSRDPLGTWGFSFGFGGGFGGPGGSFGGPGSGGGLVGGLFNFGLGLLGSLFGGGGGQRHVIGSPFFSLPPSPPILPLPGPTHSTYTATFAQDEMALARELTKSLTRLIDFKALALRLVSSGKINVITAATDKALTTLFGNVFFSAHGLNPAEIEFAKEVSAFEERSFTGAGQNAPGIDGYLHDGRTMISNPRPIQLQENKTGGVYGMYRDAVEHWGKAEKQGYHHMALYIKYTGEDVNVLNVIEYLWKDGANLGFQRMSKFGVFTDIIIFVPDGVVKISDGGFYSVMNNKK